ncbi:MAG: hypothetical protein JWQ81_5897 [Amycolatopsis sp.]|nr:hypothetical protein [Amycolatopsis sp.]
MRSAHCATSSKNSSIRPSGETVTISSRFADAAAIWLKKIRRRRSGTRAVAIPDCWLSHPGLLTELATLTYTWREAHIGKDATVKDAQYWHDR